jgi:hypothetical protein
MKAWKWMRGKKRQAGAICYAIVVILPMCGVDVPEDAMMALKALGTVLFGVGWLDKGKRVLSKED